MPLDECTFQSCPIDLVDTNHFRVVTITAGIGYRLILEVIYLAVRVVAERILEGENLTFHRD